MEKWWQTPEKNRSNEDKFVWRHISESMFQNRITWINNHCYELTSEMKINKLKWKLQQQASKKLEQILSVNCSVWENKHQFRSRYWITVPEEGRSGGERSDDRKDAETSSTSSWKDVKKLSTKKRRRTNWFIRLAADEEKNCKNNSNSICWRLFFCHRRFHQSIKIGRNFHQAIHF